MKLKSILCSFLLCALCLQLFACATEKSVKEEAVQPTAAKPLATIGTVNLMENVTPLAVQLQSVKPSNASASADFAVSLLQNTYAGENCILSPYSVYIALAMCANGASSETLQQMESVLGMTAAELNVYLYALAQNAGQELQSANSIWFRHTNGFTPDADFLQLNADYYGAGLFGADFDEQTLADINRWISEHTDGKIENALAQIDPLTMMYLINALTFDAQWKTPYDSTQIHDGTFYGANGEETAQMMFSEEHWYLDDGNAIGFIKDYAGGQYSYVALMPNEGVSMQDYIASLSGETLLATVQNATSTTVFATMPKYELSSEMQLNETLAAMGMPAAFTDAADFSRMSSMDLKIGNVLHQTYLNVDELGTQAGACTIVAMDAKGAAINFKTVVLDRPFVMAIYDNVNECFVFTGVIESVN